MKISLLIFCVFLLLFVICCHPSAGDFNSAGPIEIVVPVNHTFQLEIDELKHILLADEIKDRHVVIVSIAGAFRQGKSFMLNFFLKYLYAQYDRHNVTDWMGENENSTEIIGFKWRGGQKYETVGILMWSEIFTHDFSNGEKVAIILLDTQGIFDRGISIRDYTSIFALSMMLSSVQCYNLMNNIQEDDLQHLEYFTEYGRLALEQTDEKPFQYLLFLVRDWPYAYETGYGWNGQQIIDDIFAETDKQSHEIRALRQRIKASFQDIGAFLMPHPGLVVARGYNFTGNLHQIDSEFKQYVKELVSSLFAPDNLVVKKINGRSIRARDLITYLNAYIQIFNENSLPAPRSLLMAETEATNQILVNDCLILYVDAMKTLLSEAKIYLNQTDLEQFHENAKNAAILQLNKTLKLGDDQIRTTFKKRLEHDIDQQFLAFNQTNEERRKNFVQIAKVHNEKLIIEIEETAKTKVIRKINDTESNLSVSNLFKLFEETKQEALNEFEIKKMGDNDVSGVGRDELEQKLNNFRSMLTRTFRIYISFLDDYNVCMLKSVENHESYFNSSDLMALHQILSDVFVSVFQEMFGCNELISSFQRRIKNDTDTRLPVFVRQNDRKREQFIRTANAHNENLCNEIKSMIKEGAQAEISKTSYLDEYAMNILYLNMKELAFEMFDAGKIGNTQITKEFRDKLEQDLIDYRSELIRSNERNRPQRFGYWKRIRI